MTSLWLDNFRQPTGRVFVSGSTYDDVVVGAGLTGLITAVLLAKAGRRVGVFEARAVGAAATGHTTGKISVLQGTRLSSIDAHYPLEVTRAYAEAQQVGQKWLKKFCAEQGVAVEERDAVTYAGGESGRGAVEAEVEVGERLGLPVQFLEGEDIRLPFPAYGGVRLAGQAMFNPMEALAALATELRERGGQLHVGPRVQGVNAGSRCRIDTSEGSAFAEHVVVATGAPFLDRGAYFAKQTAQRSYVVAFRVPGPIPADMYLSADQPTRSLRTAENDELLLVGGNGHVVGRHPSPRDCVD
ncbi:MAG: NAD(P)/FAD-dependent oxidoreductase, partial [Propionibacteriaceae bacterium]